MISGGHVFVTWGCLGFTAVQKHHAEVDSTCLETPGRRAQQQIHRKGLYTTSFWRNTHWGERKMDCLTKSYRKVSVLVPPPAQQLIQRDTVVQCSLPPASSRDSPSWTPNPPLHTVPVAASCQDDATKPPVMQGYTEHLPVPGISQK